MPVPKPSTRPSLKFSLPPDELKAMFQAGLAIAEAQEAAKAARPLRMGTKAMAICPICKSAAEEIETDYSDGKSFGCPKHGEFDIAEAVLNNQVLMNAGSDKWEKALKVASANAIRGTRPRILEYNFH